LCRTCTCLKVDQIRNYMPVAFQINAASAVPKYQQIADAIRGAIERKLIRREEQLPSINELSSHYNISRDTAEKAYRLLKNKGLIISVRGKGYFAASAAPLSQRRILLLFNKLSPYKEAIYNSFVKTVGRQASVDLRVYYEDLVSFERLLESQTGKFTDYVIIPSFRGEAAILARKAVDKYLAGCKITFIESDLPGLKEKHRGVFQNYEDDIYGALNEANAHLSKYQRIKLYFPFASNINRGIIRGFQRYSLERGIESDIVYKRFAEKELDAGTAYVVIRDEQLVTLVHQVKNSGFTAGKDIGILAYNDSPLKEVLLDGISVISTRHIEMGRIAAEMVLENEWTMIENEFVFIERDSL